VLVDEFVNCREKPRWRSITSALHELHELNNRLLFSGRQLTNDVGKILGGHGCPLAVYNADRSFGHDPVSVTGSNDLTGE
jgi:hypothetical protein